MMNLHDDVILDVISALRSIDTLTHYITPDLHAIVRIIPAATMYLHALAPRFRFVVPLEWFDDVFLDHGEGIDDVGTQGRVDVLRYKLGRRRAILGPIRVVTQTNILRGSCTTQTTVLLSPTTDDATGVALHRIQQACKSCTKQKDIRPTRVLHSAPE